MTATTLPDLRIITPKRGYPRLGAADRKHVEKLEKRSSELCQAMIDAGFGHVRFNERKNYDHPVIREATLVDGELASIYAEFERRTGVKYYLHG